MQEKRPSGAPRTGPAPFGIELTIDTVSAEARLVGELDLLTAPRLQAALDHLLDDGHLNVSVDLSELDFLACAGLNVLSVAGRRYQKAGGRLTITHPSRTTRRILAVTGLDAVLHIV